MARRRGLGGEGAREGGREASERGRVVECMAEGSVGDSRSEGGAGKGRERGGERGGEEKGVGEMVVQKGGEKCRGPGGRQRI